MDTFPCITTEDIINNLKERACRTGVIVGGCPRTTDDDDQPPSEEQLAKPYPAIYNNIEEGHEIVKIARPGDLAYIKSDPISEYLVVNIQRGNPPIIGLCSAMDSSNRINVYAREIIDIQPSGMHKLYEEIGPAKIQVCPGSTVTNTLDKQKYMIMELGSDGAVVMPYDLAKRFCSEEDDFDIDLDYVMDDDAFYQQLFYATDQFKKVFISTKHNSRPTEMKPPPSTFVPQKNTRPVKKVPVKGKKNPNKLSRYAHVAKSHK